MKCRVIDLAIVQSPRSDRARVYNKRTFMDRRVIGDFQLVPFDGVRVRRDEVERETKRLKELLESTFSSLTFRVLE